MIKAAIFDMDGLLVDSEPLWDAVIAEELGKVGLPFPEDIRQETLGTGLNHLVDCLLANYPTPVNLDRVRLIQAMETRMLDALATDARPLPGAIQTVKLMHDAGLRTAIASSTVMSVIHAVVNRLNIGDQISVIHSGCHEKASKPDPAVFLSTARLLKVKPSACLVFEDAIAGIQAAKAAGMFCVAVPDPALFDNPRYEIADLKLHSLTEFNEKTLRSFL